MYILLSFFSRSIQIYPYKLVLCNALYTLSLYLYIYQSIYLSIYIYIYPYMCTSYKYQNLDTQSIRIYNLE